MSGIQGAPFAMAALVWAGFLMLATALAAAGGAWYPPPFTAAPLAAGAGGQRLAPLAPSNIAQVWANEGGDKVARQDLRATRDPNAVRNSVWDGSGVTLFGARNEVVSFNLVLEAPASAATNVDVSLTSLLGPGSTSITTTTATRDGVFNFVGRNIELFYVGYLEIKGLSTDMFYGNYDERHIPARCRRPYDGEGRGSGG